jgi:hypothetical protein
MRLKDKILNEIKRISASHDKKDVNLINNVLRPMLLFIDNHNHFLAEISRIGGKHTL